ncbi:S-layer homology domain-containing protein [Butyricicoccus pullicaecorum]|uniref:S-layer homology domain-containing protein n=1 Tax=Butyricicoccus pullicaecorum TaxID=501571 RepID=UPI0039908D06
MKKDAKRMWASVIALIMIMSIMPINAFAIEGEDTPESPALACVCEVKCTDEQVDESCPVCANDLTGCIGDPVQESGEDDQKEPELPSQPSVDDGDNAENTQPSPQPPVNQPNDAPEGEITENGTELEDNQDSQAVKDFLGLAAQLPEEITAENAEEYQELLDDCAQAWEALSETEQEREDVQQAYVHWQDIQSQADADAAAVLDANAAQGTISWVASSGTESTKAYAYVKEALTDLDDEGGGTLYVSGTVEFREDIRYYGGYMINTSITILPAGEQPAIIKNVVELKVSGEGSLQIGDDGLSDRALTLECPTFTPNTSGGIYDERYGIFVIDGGELLIKDGAYITQESNREPSQYINRYLSPIFAKSGGKITMYGGEISDNQWVWCGGAMTLEEDTDFIMYGGEICNNSVRYMGGAIYATHDPAYGTDDFEDGAPLVNGARVTIHDGLISGNTAEDRGGAIAMMSYTDFKMYDGEISENRVEGESPGVAGGAIFCSGKTFEISGGVIKDNSATTSHSASTGEGGAIAFGTDPLYSSCFLVALHAKISGNTIISGNSAGEGGAIYSSRTNQYIENYSDKLLTLTISDNVQFLKNHALDEHNPNALYIGNGGALLLEYATLTIKDQVKFAGNTATQYGGGLVCGSCTVLIKDQVEITNNRSYAFGGGIMLSEMDYILGPEGTPMEAPVVRIEGDVQIHDNLSQQGGGIYLDDLALELSDNVKIQNNTAVHGGGICLGATNALEPAVKLKVTIDDQVLISENKSVFQSKLLDQLPQEESAGTQASAMSVESDPAQDETGTQRDALLIAPSANTEMVQLYAEDDEISAVDQLTGGGGISMFCGTLVMNSGTIENNSTEGNGGGIQLYRRKVIGYDLEEEEEWISVYCEPELHMKGGAIEHNTAEKNGGGIYIPENEALSQDLHTVETSLITLQYQGVKPAFVGEITNGTICENTAQQSGGGIYLARDARLTISQNPVITNNDSANGADNVFLPYLKDMEEKYLAFVAQYQETRAKYTPDNIFNIAYIEKPALEIYQALLEGDERTIEEYESMGGHRTDTFEQVCETYRAIFDKQLDDQIVAQYHMLLEMISSGEISEEEVKAALEAELGISWPVEESEFVARYKEYALDALKEEIAQKLEDPDYAEYYAELVASLDQNGYSKYYYIAVAQDNFEQAALESGNTSLAGGVSGYLSIQAAMGKDANIGVYSQVPVIGRVIANGYPEDESAYGITKNDIAAFRDDRKVYLINPDNEDILQDGNTNQLILDLLNTYKLIYVVNGGSTVATEFYEEGRFVTLDAVTIREGYTFEGWYADEALTIPVTEVEMTSDKYVYAKWKKISDGGASHPEYTPDDDDENTDRDDEDDTEEFTDEEVPLAETPWLNTEDHYAYIIGYAEDGTVRPQANITRAEVATIFFRLLTDEARDQFWSTSNNFSDVTADAWYNNAVSTMVNAGIIQGYEDGTFRPNNNITRAEFAAIASRFMSSGYDVEEDLFTDIANHWARENINDAAMTKWINGYPDGTFLPDKAITRAEAVTLVNNVLQRKPDADHMLDSMIKWPDNPESAWYYEAIQEATNSHDYDLFEGAAYETWTSLLENRDWAALEKDWVNAHRTGGEVM